MKIESKFLTDAAVTIGVAVAMMSTPASELTLKASHQWPGGKGDVRDQMVQIIANKKANVGVDVKVYAGKSLFKPKAYWNAKVKGRLDI